MIKINIAFSKKVPGPEQFSSGSLERELSDGLSAEQIQAAFHQSYNLLESTVEQEIGNYTSTHNHQEKASPTQAFTPPKRPKYQG